MKRQRYFWRLKLIYVKNCWKCSFKKHYRRDPICQQYCKDRPYYQDGPKYQLAQVAY